ncbi:MAG: hypothetical protein HQL54_11680 [Magnetococcales bacterium]|nr:hypothetical protein [Magnetococcales bacterium]
MKSLTGRMTRNQSATLNMTGMPHVQQDLFGPGVALSESAMRQQPCCLTGLRVGGWLDSAFGKLFSSVKDAMSKEEPEVEEKIVHDFSVEHPSINPGEYRAFCRAESPFKIAIEVISCDIEFQEDGHVSIQTYSNGKPFSHDVINPTNRNSKAVSGFIFKGLIGIHVHPEGVLLFHDIDLNMKGQPRHGQPPATIHSVELDQAEVERQRSERVHKFDLSDCSEDNPFIICPNNPSKHQMHMVIEPDQDSGEGHFHALLSSAKGKLRGRSLASFPVLKGEKTIISRELFSAMIENDGGNIDARTWNMEMRDPVMLTLDIDRKGKMKMEEMLTSNGVTISYGHDDPMLIGGVEPKSEIEAQERRKLWLGQILALRADLVKGAEELALANEQAQARAQVIQAVESTMRLKTRDNVSRLAFQLAIKEVLATIYGVTGSSETAMKIDEKTSRLISEITKEAEKRLNRDEARNASMEAVRQGLSSAVRNPLLADKMSVLSEAVPTPDKEVPNRLDGELLGELVGAASKELTATQNLKAIKAKSDELRAAVAAQNADAVELPEGVYQDEEEDAEPLEDPVKLEEALDELIRGLVSKAMQKTLVLAVVKGYLLSIENEKRSEISLGTSNRSAKKLGPTELDHIVKRYESYDDYMGIAFRERVRNVLQSQLKSFQVGAADPEGYALATKGFLTYLVALRATGGNFSPTNDSAPAVSPLMVLPETIPDIFIAAPEPGQKTAHVKVSHESEDVGEVAFETEGMEDTMNVPPGVSRELWTIFHELGAHIMGFYLNADHSTKEDRRNQQVVITAVAEAMVKKMLNFGLTRDKKTASINYDPLEDILRTSKSYTITSRQGDTSNEEVLDLQNRPNHVAEPPLNLKKILKKAISGLLHEGSAKESAFRFKTQMRSFATAGQTDQDVALPIRIEVGRGRVTASGKFDDVKFEKSFKLPPKVEEKAPEPEPEPAPAPKKEPKAEPAPPSAPEVEAVREFKVCYPVKEADLPLNIGKVRVAVHGGSLVLLLLDDEGKLLRQGGKVKGQRLTEKPYAPSRSLQVSLKGNQVLLECLDRVDSLEAKLRRNRNKPQVIPVSASGSAWDLLVPRKGSDDLRCKMAMDSQGGLRVPRPFVIQKGVVCLKKKNGGLVALATCRVKDGKILQVISRIKTGVVLVMGKRHYPVGTPG